MNFGDILKPQHFLYNSPIGNVFIWVTHFSCIEVSDLFSVLKGGVCHSCGIVYINMEHLTN